MSSYTERFFSPSHPVYKEFSGYTLCSTIKLTLSELTNETIVTCYRLFSRFIESKVVARLILRKPYFNTGLAPGHCFYGAFNEHDTLFIPTIILSPVRLYFIVKCFWNI